MWVSLKSRAGDGSCAKNPPHRVSSACDITHAWQRRQLTSELVRRSTTVCAWESNLPGHAPDDAKYRDRRNNDEKETKVLRLQRGSLATLIEALPVTRFTEDA
eukprot:3387530-Rhodomonas_salina.6